MFEEPNVFIATDHDYYRPNADKFYQEQIDRENGVLDISNKKTLVAATIEKDPEEEKKRQQYRDNNWFKTPKCENTDMTRFNNRELEEDDLIFNNNRFVDPEIRIEDHKQFLYNTTPDDMYVMFPNNMVLPIIRNANIESKTKGLFNKNNWQGLFKGVYIVDYYSLKMLRENTIMFRNVMKYIEYTDSCGVLDKTVMVGLNEMLATKDYLNKYLRIITIVSSSDLLKQNVLYVPHTGLCIGKEDLLDNYVHPASDHYLHNVSKKVYSTVKNYIEIDIVDNTTSNDYFIKVGNSILKLEQERNISKPEQVGVSLWKNDKKVSDSYYTLDKINELGIYNSRIQAEKENSIAREINNKAKELEIEDNKLNANKLNSENDLKSAHYKSTKISLELQRDIVKNDFEMEKLKVEKDILTMKYEHEIETNRLDIQTRNQKIVSDIIMSKLGLMNAKMKFDLEETKHDMEMRKVKENHITATIDTIGKIIKLIGSCL